MTRIALLFLLTATMTTGCASSPVYWHEGEDFADPRPDADELVAAKRPASGMKALTGKALRNAGDSITYRFRLAKPMPAARVWIRYSRNYADGSPSKLDIAAAQREKRFAAAATLPNTGGWGADAKADWRLVPVDLGTLDAGECTVTLTAAKEVHNDLNVDGFFLAPADTAIDADHLGSADRIHIDRDRYVGLAVPSITIRQDEPAQIALVGRGFVPRSQDATVRVAFAKGPPSATLYSGSVDLGAQPVTIAVPTEKMRDFRDGTYYITAQWQSAPPMSVEVELIGQFAATFDAQMADLKAMHAAMKASDKPTDAPLALDYEHAIEFLTAGWEQMKAGEATAKMTEGVKRTLAQYGWTTKQVKQGRSPYGAQTGDLRFAFRSSTTGELEPFRLVLPDSYRPDGDMPVMLALNGNEDRFLDRADVIKQIANKRRYAIISPAAVGGYWGRNHFDLLEVIDVVLQRFSGLSRRRVYCTGASEGGFATYRLATLHPDRFAAVACAQGAGNWRRFRRADRTLIPRYSPLPTLILAGRDDPVVAATDIEQFAAELVKRDLPHELHIFDKHAHSYMNHAELYLNLTLDYFDRHTERIAPPPQPPTRPAPQRTARPATTRPQRP